MKFKHILACLVTGAVFTASTVSLHAATYTIQPGDTLSAISSKTGMSIREIMDANGITDANTIIAGNSLSLASLPTSLADNTPDSLYELFDAEYYASENPDVVAVYGTSKEALYSHFTQYGMNEGRAISPDFDVNAYRSAYPDLQNAFGDNIARYYEHYLIFGQKENRTLVTKKACIASGVTVYDFDGNVIAVPVAAASSNNNSHSGNASDNNSAGDEYWRTGTWYCVETEINADGVMQSQGHFPHELYQLTDNGDGTFSYYGVMGHGAWIDGEFNSHPFDFSSYQGKELEISHEIDEKYDNLEYCGVSWTGSGVPLGIYDEGCVHLWTLEITDAPKHNWVLDNDATEKYKIDVYTCTECNDSHYASLNHTHLDKDNDGLCDICNTYTDAHGCIDDNNDNYCDICTRHLSHIDENGDSYCDICFATID